MPEPSPIHRHGVPGALAARRGARLCSRPACSEPAGATLTYHYRQGMAWLDDMTPDRDPHGYDLCDRHADRISVPHGWRLDDRRAEVEVLAG